MEFEPEKEYNIIIQDWKTKKELFFTGKNVVITQAVISFVDKFGQQLVFDADSIIKVEPRKEAKP